MSEIAAGRTPGSLTAAHRDFFRSQPEPVRRGMGGLFREIQSFQFLGRDDVSREEIERLGTPVSSVFYFRGTGPRGPRAFSFFMTADRKIAYMTSYPFRD